MAVDGKGNPLCHHEQRAPCNRWWCSYRLLIGICAMFLAPAGASVMVPATWAPVVAGAAFTVVVVAAFTVPRWVSNGAKPPLHGRF